MIATIIPILRLPPRCLFFDYLAPEELEKKLKPGCLVQAPFRKQRVHGIVVKMRPAHQSGARSLKKIFKIILEEWLSEKQLALIQWLAEQYNTSPATAIKTCFALPVLKAKTAFRLPRYQALTPPTLARQLLPNLREILEQYQQTPLRQPLVYQYQNQKVKTAFYLKLIEKNLNPPAGGNRQILFLTPRIADIIQPFSFCERLAARKVGAIHSALPKAGLWQEWQKIRDGQRKIIIGTRSALFAPFQNLGLIIIDEAGAEEYQTEQAPYYQTEEVAEKLAQLHQAQLIALSQAPDIRYYFLSQQKKLSWLCHSAPVQQPVFINLKEELQQKNFSPISAGLQEAIQETLSKKKKAVLLLNRLGFTTVNTCPDCGYLHSCPTCRLPLVLHQKKEGQFLCCHHCQTEKPLRLTCPSCHGPRLQGLGIGIQKVEQAVKKLFPKEKILRIEKTTEMEASLTGQRRQRLQTATIIIGTRLLLQHYQPWLADDTGLIGIISADILLYRPDYRAAERTFQWLKKIVNLGNEWRCPAIIQSYVPDHFVMQAIAEQNDSYFYQPELADRQKFGYPPFRK